MDAREIVAGDENGQHRRQGKVDLVQCHTTPLNTIGEPYETDDEGVRDNHEVEPVYTMFHKGNNGKGYNGESSYL